MKSSSLFPRWLSISLLVHLVLFGLFGVVAQNTQLATDIGEVSMEVSLVKPQEVFEEEVPLPETEIPDVVTGESENSQFRPEIPAIPVEARPPVPVPPTARPKVEVPNELKKKAQEKQPAAVNQPTGSRNIKPASIRRSPLPKYPRAAIRAGIEDVVTVLRVTIGPDGRARSVSVVRSCGREDMDASAVRTVESRWRFAPARRLGKPVESTEQITIRWQLR